MVSLRTVVAGARDAGEPGTIPRGKASAQRSNVESPRGFFERASVTCGWKTS